MNTKNTCTIRSSPDWRYIMLDVLSWLSLEHLKSMIMFRSWYNITPSPKIHRREQIKEVERFFSVTITMNRFGRQKFSIRNAVQRIVERISSANNMYSIAAVSLRKDMSLYVKIQAAIAAMRLVPNNVDDTLPSAAPLLLLVVYPTDTIFWNIWTRIGDTSVPCILLIIAGDYFKLIKLKGWNMLPHWYAFWLRKYNA